MTSRSIVESSGPSRKARAMPARWMWTSIDLGFRGGFSACFSFESIASQVNEKGARRVAPPVLIFEGRPADPAARAERIGLGGLAIPVGRGLRVSRWPAPRLLGPRDGCVRFPEWQGRADITCPSRRPGSPPARRPIARPPTAFRSPDRRSSREVLPERQQSPKHQRHRRISDPAGRQQVDRDRQRPQPQGVGGNRETPPERPAEDDGRDPRRAQDQPSRRQAQVQPPTRRVRLERVEPAQRTRPGTMPPARRRSAARSTRREHPARARWPNPRPAPRAFPRRSTLAGRTRAQRSARAGPAGRPSPRLRGRGYGGP